MAAYGILTHCRLFLASLISIMLFIKAPSSFGDTPPEEAFGCFVQAIQDGDTEKAFDLDYTQRNSIKGKFKYEIESIKENYRRSFEGNPSICPGFLGCLPCDGSRQRDSILNIRLFIPKMSQYAISETVYLDDNKDSAKMLVNVTYPLEKQLVYAYDFNAIQVYKGGLPPLPPLLNGVVICDAENVLFSAKDCGTREYRFPFTYKRQNIKTATLLVYLDKIADKWLVRTVDINQMTYSDVQQISSIQQRSAYTSHQVETTTAADLAGYWKGTGKYKGLLKTVVCDVAIVISTNAQLVWTATYEQGKKAKKNYEIVSASQNGLTATYRDSSIWKLILTVSTNDNQKAQVTELEDHWIGDNAYGQKVYGTIWSNAYQIQRLPEGATP